VSTIITAGFELCASLERGGLAPYAKAPTSRRTPKEISIDEQKESSYCA